MVAAAVIGSAVVGAGTTIATGSSASHAQDRATQAATQTQQEALAQQALLSAPYRQAGELGQNRMLELLGLGPNTNAEGYGSLNQPFQFNEQDLYNDPGYQFRMSEGLKATGAAQAAQGKYLSGASLKALERYGQGLASQEYQNAYNNAFTRFQANRANQLAPLQYLTGTGQAAAAGQAANIGNASANIANLQTQAGNAQAAGYINTGNAINNGLGQIANYYTSNAMLNQLLGSNRANTNSAYTYAPGGDQ